MFIFCAYIHVNKQSPRDDHQDNYITSQVKTWWGHGWQSQVAKRRKRLYNYLEEGFIRWQKWEIR